MARGITQDQVDQAADAILSAGENPTVEKVRAALGTGSPNTITRMLDSWRSQLGDRLRQLSTLPELPASVGQAMIELWRLATEQAEHVLDSRFAQDRATLDAAQVHLVEERHAWQLRLEAADTSVAQAHAARDLAEHACGTLDGQLQDSHALRADLVQQRDRLQGLCDRQVTDIEALHAERAAWAAASDLERQQSAAHIRAVEDRAHQEVDRSRQEAQGLKQQLDALQRHQARELSDMRQQLESLRQALNVAEKEAAHQAGRAAALEAALATGKPSKSRSRKAAAADKASMGERNVRGASAVAAPRKRTKPSPRPAKT